MEYQSQVNVCMPCKGKAMLLPRSIDFNLFYLISGVYAKVAALAAGVLELDDLTGIVVPMIQSDGKEASTSQNPGESDEDIVSSDVDDDEEEEEEEEGDKKEESKEPEARLPGGITEHQSLLFRGDTDVEVFRTMRSITVRKLSSVFCVR